MAADKNQFTRPGKKFGGRHRLARIEKFQADQRRKREKRKRAKKHR